MTKYLPTVLEMVGAVLLTYAGWLVFPPLGIALAGVMALAAAYALERPNDHSQ